jgi:hypothetical protein
MVDTWKLHVALPWLRCWWYKTGRRKNICCIMTSVIREITQDGPKQFLEMSDKPHPRQLYCGRAASITKISLSLSGLGRCVCQLLSGLKVKICPEVTEPQKCQPQYKEQRSLELSRWRQTSDNEHPRISRHFLSRKKWKRVGMNCTQQGGSWFTALLGHLNQSGHDGLAHKVARVEVKGRAIPATCCGCP